MGTGKKRRVSWLLLLVVGVLLLCLAAGLWLANSPVAAEYLCRTLEQRLSQTLQRQVRTGYCNIDILPPAVEVHGLAVEPDARGNRFHIERLRVELASGALLGGRLRLAEVDVDGPRVRWALASERRPWAGEAAGPAIPLDLLPERIRLTQGSVELSLAAGHSLRLDGIELTGQGTPRPELRGSLSATGGQLQVAGQPPVPLGAIGLRADWQPGKLQLDECRVEARGGSLTLRGTLLSGQAAAHAFSDWLPEGWKAKLRLTARFPVESWSHWWTERFRPRGQVQLQVRVDPDESEPLLVELTAPELHLAASETWTLTSRAVLHQGVLELQRLQLDGGNRRLVVSGQLQLHEKMNWQAELEMQRLPLPRILAAWGRREVVAGDCSGRMSLSGSLGGRRRADVNGKFTLNLDELGWQVAAAGRTWAGRLAAPQLSGRWRIGSRALSWSNLHLQSGSAWLRSSGEFAWQQGLRRVQLEGEGLELAGLLGGLEPAPAGLLAAQLEYQGGARRNGRLELQLGGLRLGKRQLGNLRGSLRLEQDLLKIHNLGLRGPAGRLFVNGRLALEAPYAVGLVVDLAEAPLADLLRVVQGVAPPGELSGTVGGRVKVSGSLQRPSLALQVAASQVVVGPQLVDEAGLVGRFAGGSWHLDLLEARLGPGWVYAQGDITPGLEVNLSVYSTGLTHDSFSWLAERLGLRCRLDLNLQARGPLLAPVLQGWVKVYDSSLAGVLLEDSFVSAQATADQVKVEGRFLGRQARLVASLENRKLLPFEARLDFAPLELSRLPPLNSAGNWLRVRSSGQLTLRGKLLSPWQSSGTLVLRGLQLQLADTRLQATGDWQVRLRGSAIEFDELQLSGRLAGVQLQGHLDLRRGPAVRVLANLQLEQLLPRLPWLQRARGRLVASLGLAGGWRALRLAGQAQLQASGVKFAAWPQPLDRLNARLRMDESGIELLGINGSAGGGRISGLGRIELEDWRLGEINCSFDLDRVGSRIGSSMEAVVSGNLSLNKPRGRLLVLGGYLNVHQASYREKTTLVNLSQGLFRRRLLPSRAYDQEREQLGLDLRLSLPDTLQVDYDLGLIRYTATMGGQLRVTGSNERLGLLGELEASRGQVRYLTRDFEVNSAVLRFLDEYAIVPRFELMAELLEAVERGEREGGTSEYRIKLQVRVEGDQQPYIALRSEPPLDERDIVTLLNLGVTSQDVETLRGEDLVGLGGEILARSLALDEKLRRIFPFPPQVVQPKYLRVRSRYSTSARAQRSGAISPRLEIGARLNFVSPDLEMDYGRSLYDDTDQNLDLTYHFSPAVSARLRWENAEQDSPLANIGDLGLDLRLRWEW